MLVDVIAVIVVSFQPCCCVCIIIHMEPQPAPAEVPRNTQQRIASKEYELGI